MTKYHLIHCNHSTLSHHNLLPGLLLWSSDKCLCFYLVPTYPYHWKTVDMILWTLKSDYDTFLPKFIMVSHFYQNNSLSMAWKTLNDLVPYYLPNSICVFLSFTLLLPQGQSEHTRYSLVLRSLHGLFPTRTFASRFSHDQNLQLCQVFTQKSLKY